MVVRLALRMVGFCCKNSCNNRGAKVECSPPSAVAVHLHEGAPMTELLTIREVAKELRISPNTVYSEVRLGRLRAIRLSHRCTRVKRADLDAYLAAHASRPPRRNAAV